jgi:hypothetical protein
MYEHKHLNYSDVENARKLLVEQDYVVRQTGGDTIALKKKIYLEIQ